MRRFPLITTASGQYFYNDVFRYSPEKVSLMVERLQPGKWNNRMCKDEWRKFVSPTCPGPRSAHAVVATSAGGGKLFLFGTVSEPLFIKAEHSSYLRRQVGSFLPYTRTVFITIVISGVSIFRLSHGIA